MTDVIILVLQMVLVHRQPDDESSFKTGTTGVVTTTNHTDLKDRISKLESTLKERDKALAELKSELASEKEQSSL